MLRAWGFPAGGVADVKWSTGSAVFLTVALVGAGSVVRAHNAICSCFDNGDDTITCEGGFSDGGKAEGVPIRVYDQSGKVLVEGKMGKSSDFKFARPKVPFRVEFDAGEGHVVKIDGRDIEK
jgi:hypothetical protein